MNKDTVIASLQALPQATFLTGQSGGGKGVFTAILNQWFAEYELPMPLHVGLGAEFRKTMDRDTDFGQKTKSLINGGNKGIDFVAASYWWRRMEESLMPGQRAIIDGGPRSVMEVQCLTEGIRARMPASALIIEVLTAEDACYQRLYRRTEQDHRPDCWDDIMQKPSEQKIRNKMSWWTRNRDEIKRAAEIFAIPYLTIANPGTMEGAQKNLAIALAGIAPAVIA